MTLSVEVETARRERTLVLPRPLCAARPVAIKPACWCCRMGAPRYANVRLGLRTLDAVEVLDGLKEGDTALRGNATLQEGQRVRARTVPWTTRFVRAHSGGPRQSGRWRGPCVDRHHGALSLPPCGSGPASSFAWRCASCAKGACRPCSSSWAWLRA